MLHEGQLIRLQEQLMLHEEQIMRLQEQLMLHEEQLMRLETCFIPLEKRVSRLESCFHLTHEPNFIPHEKPLMADEDDALKRWEPRVVVTSVQASREQQDGENVLPIRLRYNVISTNAPGNNVILAGVEQTVWV